MLAGDHDVCKNTGIMSAQKIITVHLEADDYNRLETEARRQGMEPEALVQTYVHAVLHSQQAESEQRKQAMLDALDRFDQIAAGTPPFDAEEVARESRKDLERRSLF